ncbi:MAG: lamin tail domain-containing protein [Planctomycetes bacterium]|nr:lamin tail domain-containing protein [Planctomycetota bacterium]
MTVSPAGAPFLAAVLLALAADAPAGDIVINEIHYESRENWLREEFIELHNAGGQERDLSGWFFSNGIEYEIPQSTRLAPGGYLVIAQDPPALEAGLGFGGALGPWTGRLDNDGDRVVLRNAAGGIEDEVEYALQFPWPLASAGDGNSMELIHPSLDNALGGSWRPSGYVDDIPAERRYLLRRQADGWLYRKGLSEASDPASAWRELDFQVDPSWRDGQTSIGFGDDDDNTVLDDMRGTYSSIFLRHTFQVEDAADFPRMLTLSLFIDDGCIVWINGVEVARKNMDEGDIPFDGTASASSLERWEDFPLPSPSGYLVPGENIIAIHGFNRTISSSDFSIDVDLFVPGADDLGEGAYVPPSPGARNSVYSDSPPPQVYDVEHAPLQPAAEEPFVVRARVADPRGVASVTLRVQYVEPGDYIPSILPLPHAELLLVQRPDPRRAPIPAPDPNPAFEDPAAWVAISMADDGLDADDVAGDGIYTAIVPGRPNRTLVRYRIEAVGDGGASVRVPYPDDPSRNFAAFVYDGVPPYVAETRSIQPGGAGYVYPAAAMTSLPVYILIAREEDVRECIAADTALQIPQGTQARFVFNWGGAFVYEGIVYDHIRFRLRGANGRYQIPGGNPGNAPGKRHWRFKFNRGHPLRARDRFGNLHPKGWSDLNTGRMFGNRLDGNWGLGDQVNDVIWMAYGVPAAFGHAFHFRVVDGPEEAPAGRDGQHLGDFWGIARAFENYDVRFLEAHGLPKGNVYKLVNQTKVALEQQRYQAPDAVFDGSDHNNIENRLRPNMADDWLYAHVEWEEWFRYHGIVQAIRHYDYWADANKNAAWYFYPDYRPENSDLGLMWTFPFDADATWGPTWNSGIDRPYDAIFGGSGKPAFQRAYRNHVREVLDLLWQRDELLRVIRQTASFMDALEEADIDRWKDAPAAAGRQYFSAANQRSLEGKIADMLKFAFTGGSWPGGDVGAGGRLTFLQSLADGADGRNLPETPTIAYVGPAGYPMDGLTFRSSAFADPQGAGTFEAMKWRIAEISDIPDPGSIPLSDPIWRKEPVRLELAAVWESEDLTAFAPEITIPSTVVEPGRQYRVRARMMDTTGLWSHWSAPVEFVAGEAAARTPEQDGLRVTEIMYNPYGDSGFEFLELRNVGPVPLDLTDVCLRDGVEFCFAEGAVPTLEPGAYVVVVENLPAFSRRYDTSQIAIAGQYRGNLSNGGDVVSLVQGASRTILAFRYEDDWYLETDGQGYSLVLRDSSIPTGSLGARDSWRSSLDIGGSPGRDDESAGGLQLPGDAQQDGRLDLADGIVLLGHLFAGDPASLPCGDGTTDDPANRTLLDLNADGAIDLGDGIYLLNYLFASGPPPVAGSECRRIAGCPEACR